MLYKDGNGFPLTLKPSHLTNPVERMDTAEILSMIVEQACLYIPEQHIPEQPVGVSKTNKLKQPKEVLTAEVKVPNEALSKVESPNETLTSVVKVSGASPDLVRYN